MGSFIEGCACNNCSKDQVKGDDESDSESITENEPKDLGIKSRREKSYIKEVSTTCPFIFIVSTSRNIGILPVERLASLITNAVLAARIALLSYLLPIPNASWKRLPEGQPAV